MKKLLKIIGITLGVLVLLLILIPILFKDRIRDEVKKALDENLEATIVLDPGKVGLSLISNFPHFTFSIEDFGILNKAPFEGDTLLFAGNFETTIDLMSVIGGGQIK
ncbi:MAG TPA: membrane biogenesis protein, partial [Catalimonadaceae bacterium]|nr:membrane biogenesis protein [Catalimonadaceae bacterium]